MFSVPAISMMGRIEIMEWSWKRALEAKAFEVMIILVVHLLVSFEMSD
jgi:hypothetical protein